MVALRMVAVVVLLGLAGYFVLFARADTMITEVDGTFNIPATSMGMTDMFLNQGMAATPQAMSSSFGVFDLTLTLDAKTKQLEAGGMFLV
jgi:hypothetical protein